MDGKIVLELKAVSAPTDVFRQQTLSYLRSTGLRLGILFNFGSTRVEYTRVANCIDLIRAIGPFVRFVIGSSLTTGGVT